MLHSQLVSQLQSFLGLEGHSDLEALLAITIEMETSKRQEIANFLFQWISSHPLALQEESLLTLICKTLAKLLQDKADLLLATLYYQFGLTSKNTYYLEGALHCLNQAYLREGDLFKDFHLWGKILVALGHLTAEETVIEKGLDQYAYSLAKQGETLQLLWDWALGWQALYDFSKEPADLKQALDLFKRAKNKGAATSQFYIDYALCLERFALNVGDPYLLNKAMRLYRKVLKDPVFETMAWEHLAIAQSHIAELTHSKQDFLRADRLFEEAITTCPSLANLWLHWGKMLFHIGWSRGRIPILESAVEKLTALKVSETDQILATAWLSLALMALGVLIDDGKLIAEGTSRVEKLLALYPHDTHLIYAQGFSNLARGIYFSDVKSFAQAVDLFSQQVAVKGDHADAWFGLYETYLNWGEMKGDHALLQKAHGAAVRLAELRPFSAFYHTQVAEALLSRCRLHPPIKNAGRFIEEAINKLQYALSLHEEFESALQLGRAWDALGEVTGESSCFEKSARLLEALYTKLPTDLRVLTCLGTSLMHLGEKKLDPEHLFRAVGYFEKVLKNDAENASLHEKLGYCKLLLATLFANPHHSGESDRWWSEAEHLLQTAARLGCHKAYYPLACLYSLTGHMDFALDNLKRAEVHRVLPPIEALEHETWLEPLRETEAFNDFLSHLKER